MLEAFQEEVEEGCVCGAVGGVRGKRSGVGRGKETRKGGKERGKGGKDCTSHVQQTKHSTRENTALQFVFPWGWGMGVASCLGNTDNADFSILL